MINVAVLGYGTVGSGVVEVINTNHESINKRAGQEINVKYVLDLRDFPGDPVEKILVHDYEQIVNDPEVDIVVEVMGGVEPAYTFVKKALLAGKNVCTSNKALVADKGRELMDIAREKSINFLFEASCGGGIPIIRVINSSLTGDEIDEVTGILNGTTNYMLYKMSTEGCEFDTVLKEAQQKGYAEADPTADVEGYDACRKIAILSSLAYSEYFDYKDIYTEGITKITPEDMEYAAKLGRTIKLLGTSRRNADGTCYAMVAPFLIGRDSPLYSVNDVFNAVFVHGNMLGDAMFYGSGAGKLPTASAVVGDIVDAAKHLHTNIFTNWNSTPAKLRPLDQVSGRFFVRVKKEAAEEAKEVFENAEMICLDQLPEECAFITTDMTQGEFCAKAEKLGDKVLAKIRVKD
ncbi:homoserine dehydrogenase [Blautia wexlerae]|uniref:Homoserine dehydrogenase n=1 Tax=Blautia wexlerae TaxID=418240 RepID=A0ABX2GP33_9FIRM|nr:homoserine dehydrogenase [Blautia wexlerae]MDD7419532.1 homoserine dehydrogenase [Ruminococcus sp.]NSF74132.1 homoserine dehydrogenase [Blautia wexlerae]